MKFPFSVLLAMSLIACGEEEPKEEVDPLTVDDDGDGFSEEQGDCDDTNPDLSPGATEVCDEIDNDCDGDIDDADSSVDLSTGSVFYADADMDGFGSATEIQACALPEGAVENMDDCDDDNADVNPDASEVCDGGIDNDCDGMADDADDSLDASTGTEFWADADGDGEGDANASMWACETPEAHVDNMTDCDDSDAALNNADVDADGFATCADANGVADCDDTGTTDLLTTAEDGDCDGTLTADDCDDMDAMSTIMADDMDCDGLLPVADGGTDCDDMDAAVGATDADGDGFLACVDDCDDADATLYPGVAFNEADTTLCVADADGDGYAVAEASIGACIDINMADTYGDGWNSGMSIEIYEDGVMTGSYSNSSSMAANEVQTEQHCFDAATVSASAVFVAGSYAGEIEGSFADSSDATELGSFTGTGSFSGTQTLDFSDGMSYGDGETFLTIDPTTLGETMGLTGGSDCDDADASTFGDDDGDGATYCTTDCDDSDATLNADDLDMDGYSSCDGDCNDDATDADGDGVADGAAFNPGMTETWYDGIDSDCAGDNDFDQDGDGYEPIEYDDGTGTMIAHGGLDCKDDSASYTPLAMEANPNACYYDGDMDGYGDDTPSSTAEGYGVIAGTDCYDGWSSTSTGAFIYPGAAYAESASACMKDADEDGWGDASPSSFYNAEAGTDCDDSDAMLAPDIDGDGDGVSVCDDCDDADSAAQGGLVFDDADGDGEGDVDDSGTLVCDLTDLDADDDGTNDLSLTNMDCDDSDAATIGDDDMDGFYTCGDANGLTDCDDTDAATYPGAGFNEAGFVMGDYSTYECLTDGDGDGYAYGFSNPFNAGACLDIEMTDTFGDSWNGNAIEIYEDGVLTGTYANEDLDGVSNSSTGGETQTIQHCLDANSMTVEFVYVSGSYAGEMSGSITDTTDGTVLASFTGTSGSSWSGTATTIDLDNGMSYEDGGTFLALGSLGGTDADDNDSSVW